LPAGLVFVVSCRSGKRYGCASLPCGFAGACVAGLKVIGVGRGCVVTGVCETGVAILGVCEPGVVIRGVCDPGRVWEIGPVCETGEAIRVCETGGSFPAFFARPGGMQPELPGVQPHPVFLPWLHPGGVPPFCFQLALPWLKPSGLSLLATCLLRGVVATRG
jgi:hypothetical protein